MKNPDAPSQPLPSESALRLRRKRQIILVVWAFRLCEFIAVIVLLFYASPDVQRRVMLLSPTLRLTESTSDATGLFFHGASSLLSGFLTLAAAVILLLCFLKKRFFCRYVCPVGFCVDAAAIIRRKLFKQKFGRYGLLLRPRVGFAFFSTFWALTLLTGLLNHRLFSNTVSAPALAFDPLAILSRVLVAPEQTTFIIAAFVICFLISPLFWRYQFCPCGALQELLYLPKRLLQRLRTKPNRDKELRRSETVQEEDTQPVHSRRRFFATGGAITLSLLFYETLRRQLQRTKTFFFSPPGAVSEGEFLTRCTRCGRCIAACPNQLLTLVRFDEASASDVNMSETQTDAAIIPNAQVGLLAQAVLRNVPQVDFSSGKQYCEKECVACTQACPTGALRPLLPEEKSRTPIALAAFDAEHCMLTYDQECSICRRECPYEAIDFIWDEEEYTNLPIIDEERCVGCGRCVVSCPGEPVFREFDEEKEMEEEPSERIKALSLVRRS